MAFHRFEFATTEGKKDPLGPKVEVWAELKANKMRPLERFLSPKQIVSWLQLNLSHVLFNIWTMDEEILG